MLLMFGRVLAFGFALLAGTGAAASLVVHVASLAGVNLLGERSMGLIALHVGVFAVFIPMVLASGVESLVARRRPDYGGRLAKAITGVLFAYALANLFWCMFLMKGREASTAGDPEFAANVESVDPLTTRAFSGHWMLFYFVPLAYFARRALGAAR